MKFQTYLYQVQQLKTKPLKYPVCSAISLIGVGSELTGAADRDNAVGVEDLVDDVAANGIVGGSRQLCSWRNLGCTA
nr:hypothetical protein Itr_chr06CG11310 [Ipomoea trifida]